MNHKIIFLLVMVLGAFVEKVCAEDYMPQQTLVERPTQFYAGLVGGIDRMTGRRTEQLSEAAGLTTYTDNKRILENNSTISVVGGFLWKLPPLPILMGPEVYLKALAMARNVAHQDGTSIAKFTTAVFDLIPLDDDYHRQAPKTDPRYYYRPWKTILVRTVADGGQAAGGSHRRGVREAEHRDPRRRLDGGTHDGLAWSGARGDVA
jgi:hypothetical protein